MPLQLKRIGEMSEEKHATNVDGKVAPRYSRTVWRLGGLCNAFWTNRKDLLTLLDDEDDMSPEDEAIGMVVQDGFTPSAVETSCSGHFCETWSVSVSETWHWGDLVA